MKKLFRNRVNKWPSKIIYKNNFKGEWPFVDDEIKIEKRNLSCIVIINNIEYALNGIAQMHYNLQAVHDAGKAVIGKSISPFIKLGLKLK